MLINLSTPHPEPLTLTLPSAKVLPLRQTVGRLGRALLALLTTTALATGLWSVVRADELRTYATNPRRILAESRIQRGKILDRDGEILANIQIDATGYVTRTYPIPEAAPVVGYATLQYGTEGIEATCDTRLRGEVDRTPWQAVQAGLLHQTPVGRNAYLTIDARLQQTAQQLLAANIGAAVLVDTRTGDVLALASSPTYDPATVETDWANLRDAADAPLLNRATQGLAQPGSALQTIFLSIASARGRTPGAGPASSALRSASMAHRLTCAQTPTDNTWAAASASGCPAPFAALESRNWTPPTSRRASPRGVSPMRHHWNIPTVAALWDPAAIDVTREVVGQGDLLVTPVQMVSVAATLGNDGVRVHSSFSRNHSLDATDSEPTGRSQVISRDIAKSILELWPHYGKAVGHIGEALAGPNRTQVVVYRIEFTGCSALCCRRPDRESPATSTSWQNRHTAPRTSHRP